MENNITTPARRDNRFVRVCRKMLTENRKTILIMTGGYLGIFLIIGLWSGYLGTTPGSGNVLFYIMMAGLACAVMASKMFFDMTSKEGRTAVLMLPATAVDKFLPRLIFALPVMLIIVVLGYLVFDGSMILAAGLTYDYWAPVFNPFAHLNDSDWTVVWMLVAGFLFNESLFIFGSVAWPRKSFLKTIGIFIVIQTLMSLGVILFHHMGLRLHINDRQAFLLLTSGTVTVISVGIVYLSYIRFKRSTILK